MIFVADTNTVVSAIFWPRCLARRCLARAVRARWRLAVSDEVFAEYREVTERIRRDYFPRHSPEPFLDWIHRRALWIDTMPLGRQRSRDADDDIFLACAVPARARYIVSRDRDLLDLRKPFGVEVLSPREFLRKLPRL